MVKKVIIVSAHVLYFSFTPFYVRQVRLSGTPVYVSLCWFTLVGRDVELDNKPESSNPYTCACFYD